MVNKIPEKEFIDLVNSLQKHVARLAKEQRLLADDMELISNAVKALNDPSIQALTQEIQAEARRVVTDDAFFGTNIREALRILRDDA